MDSISVVNMQTTDNLVDLIGVIGAQEFESSPDSEKPRLLEWIASLRGMSERDFFDTCRDAIYGSASVARFRGNFEADHCRATACFHESKRRFGLAGHREGCTGPTIYGRAHAALMREHRYTPTSDGTCMCELSA